MESLIRLEGEQELLELKYPAATVLLDLTANEDCIEKIALEMH